MASDKEFFLAAFETIFRNLNPAQRSTFSESFAAACVAASRETTADDMGQEGTSNVVDQQAEPEPNPPAKAISRIHKRRESATGNKRVVNGFICFRSFYCTLFEDLAQRFKSGLIRQMWSMESRRNIFGLLGRAFSDLRDNHAESVSMEGFLAVAAEAVPLVPAGEYLAKMGWQIETQVGGDIVLRRDVKFNVDIVNMEYPPQTRLSVADIVEHCYARGLLNRGTRRRSTGTDANRRPQGGSVNMAVAAAPPQGCFALEVAPQPETIDAEIQHFVRRAESTPSSSTSTTVSTTEDSEMENSDNYLTIDAVTADQQAAYDQLEIGFHFHPDMPQILAFDPRIVQHDFDPFDLDLNAYIDFESET